MATIKIEKKLEVPNNVKMNCLAWNKKSGFLAYPDCKTLKAVKLKPAWEMRYPPLEKACPGSDKDTDPRCAVSVPGFGHPHVIMVDDLNYNLHINI